MLINQTDIRTLADNDVKKLAVMASDVADLGGPFAVFWRSFTHALVRAARDRSQTLVEMEQSLIDADDEIGALVGPAYFVSAPESSTLSDSEMLRARKVEFLRSALDSRPSPDSPS